MKVTANLEARYVPKWNGNRDLPENEQVSVEILWPTNKERETLKGYRLSPKTEEVTVYFDTERILEKHVGKIENLEVQADGKAVTIESGKDLARSSVLALGGLIDELKGYVSSEEGLSEDEAKN